MMQSVPNAKSSIPTVLIVTAMEGAQNCADSLARQLELTVDVAATRSQALSALRRREYSVVVVDDSLVEADASGADLLWKHSGLAFPMQFNFAISSGARLAREVRTAIGRRNQELALARRDAARALESELKSITTGLILQTELALSESALNPSLEEKLKLIADLAAKLRRQLETARM